jgi:hypothetical protein
MNIKNAKQETDCVSTINRKKLPELAFGFPVLKFFVLKLMCFALDLLDFKNIRNLV